MFIGDIPSESICGHFRVAQRTSPCEKSVMRIEPSRTGARNPARGAHPYCGGCYLVVVWTARQTACPYRPVTSKRCSLFPCTPQFRIPSLTGCGILLRVLGSVWAPNHVTTILTVPYRPTPVWRYSRGGRCALLRLVLVSILHI